MKVIFLCSSANQLIVYHLLSDSRCELPHVNNISVIVNNPYCINASQKIISQTAFKLGYKEISFSKEYLKSSLKEKVILISRRNPSNDELRGILKSFIVMTHYTIEDGIGDYINECYYYNTTLSYKLRNIKFKIRKIIGLALRLVNLSYCNWYMFISALDFTNKVKLPLILSKDVTKEMFCKLYYEKNEKNIDLGIKVIVLGSLYSHDKDENKNIAIRLYSKINNDFLSNKIKKNEILYIPHPRAEYEVSKYVTDNYGWKNNVESFTCAEEAICKYDKAEIWSIGSTAQLYSLGFLNRKCVVFSDKVVLKHPSIINICNYLVSLGAVNIEYK